MSDENFTPVDRPIMLSDLNAIKVAVQNTEAVQRKMYNEFKAYRDRVRYPVAVCVVSALVCLVSLFVRVSP